MAVHFLLYSMISRMPQDSNSKEIRQTLKEIDLQIAELHKYIYTQSGEQRQEVRLAIQRAIQIALTFARIDHSNMPLHPPISPNGELVLGPELREMILEQREVYELMGQIRDSIDGFLDDTFLGSVDGVFDVGSASEADATKSPPSVLPECSDEGISSGSSSVGIVA